MQIEIIYLGIRAPLISNNNREVSAEMVATGAVESKVGTVEIGDDRIN
jgi:hypothetical protein